jgi:predicted Zn-dependent protease
VAECLALTATHELGHAIGIFTHSPVETDLMFVDPVVSTLSARDRATIERAYHVTPNLAAPAR